MARNNLKMSLQEGLKEVQVLVEEVLEETRKKQYTLYEEFLQMYSKEYKCKQMWVLLCDYKNKYEELLKEDMLHMFEKWEESEGSVCAFVKNAGSDDDSSIDEARRFEGNIRDYMEEMVSKELEQPVEDILDMKGSLEQMMEDMIQLYNQELRDLEDITYDMKHKVENNEEDNYIYLPIGVLLEALLHVNTNFYEKLRSYTTQEVTEQMLQQKLRAEGSIENARSALNSLIS